MTDAQKMEMQQNLARQLNFQANLEQRKKVMGNGK